MTPKLIIVRHGDTKLNVANTVRGWLDEPLDASGVNGAWSLASKLAKAYPNAEMIWSSDLRRTMQTAQAIATCCKLPSRPTYFLRPWNAGSLTGKPIKGLEKVLTHYGLHPNEAPDGGEPMREMLTRVVEIFRYLLRQDGQMIIVTHTRPINILVQWLDAGLPATVATYIHIKDVIEPLGVLLVYRDDDGRLRYTKETF